MRSLLLLALLVAAPALAQPALGTTSFANSGAVEAQEPFLRGLLLLHSFEYDDARAAFQEARQVDPDFAMAAWGEAMTHNHPIWQQQDTEAARAALAGVPTDGLADRERAYLATAQVLYGEGDKDDRDDAFAEAMRGLAEAFPDDLDARALYALSLLGTSHEGRDVATYMRAAAVAEEVFDENPQHPGAAHYLIHAYDDPVHAPLGLRPARVYADLAPAASHALHMPTHIYLALGLWEDVAAMNRRSFEAAKAGTDRRGEPLNNHGWHALYWLAYAQMQARDDEGALATLAVADSLYSAGPTRTALSHLVRIRAHVALGATLRSPEILFAFQEGEWRSLPRSEMDPVTEALDRIAVVHALAFDPADLGALEATAERLRELASAPDARPEVRMMAQMYGTGVLTEGPDRSDATIVEAIREAVDLLDAEPIAFGPPTPVLLPHEMLIMFLDSGESDAEAACLLERIEGRSPARRVTAILRSDLADRGVTPRCNGPSS